MHLCPRLRGHAKFNLHNFIAGFCRQQQETGMFSRTKSWDLIHALALCVCVCVSPSGCDHRCLLCQAPGRCQQCQAPFAVLQGQCVRRCGRNYFLDAASRHCKRKRRFCKTRASRAVMLLIHFREDSLQQICIIWLRVIQTMEPKTSGSRATVAIVSADGWWGRAPAITAAK